MRKSLLLFSALALCFACAAVAQPNNQPVTPGPLLMDQDKILLEPLEDNVAAIIGKTMTSDVAYERLRDLCDNIGHRLSGSPELEEAIEWAIAGMKRDGLDNVHKEEVMVPHWVRGKESAQILSPRSAPLHILGLGNSTATPRGGIEAEVFAVSNYAELEAAGRSKVEGKIVLFNAPFTTYGQTVTYRYNGPSRAGKLGAVACLVRSIGPSSLDTPHTGSMGYAADDDRRVPAAAITIEDAERLHRWQRAGTPARVRLEMEAHFKEDAPSFNVVAELRGSQIPEEVVIVSGHLDAWDVGDGAQDDGAGCMMAWETLRILKELGIRPRRTLRVVLFTNEENGLAGGNAYRDAHMENLSNIVAAFESDSGNGLADGFRLDVRALPLEGELRASDELTEAQKSELEAVRPIALERAEILASMLESLGGSRIHFGGAGADIGPMMRMGVIGFGLNHDTTEYFKIHHTKADTFEKIIPADLQRNTAIMAVMAYLIADLPDRLLPVRKL
ncbi:MAG: M20/M25/M40 family metallo-hydrolase [Candidatus Eisenbacteria bacterium]|uniref:Carboxypeptidase Q n=1 Tax=Eiseniibacteriota bacterium TaxID=2212470 RepID=A0A7Y2EBM1_UNCEI|nr:M20/M25/M40 family metallo-hydrolase [Candidatus Eisenbacteria bacterium]